jgi:excinuclease UvrABC nuclease subunit
MVYKQKLQRPYKKGTNKCTFDIRNYPGVYMIYSDSKELLYVGYSGSDVYKALYRHFQSWNDKRQIRVTFNPDKVKVKLTYTNTGKEASDLETALIIKYQPKKNPQKYIDYTTEPAEAKMLESFEEAPTEPVAEYTDDIPF